MCKLGGIHRCYMGFCSFPKQNFSVYFTEQSTHVSVVTLTLVFNPSYLQIFLITHLPSHPFYAVLSFFGLLHCSLSLLGSYSHLWWVFIYLWISVYLFWQEDKFFYLLFCYIAGVTHIVFYFIFFSASICFFSLLFHPCSLVLPQYWPCIFSVFL